MVPGGLAEQTGSCGLLAGSAKRRQLDHPVVLLSQHDAAAVVGRHMAGQNDAPVWAHVRGLVLMHRQHDGQEAVVAGALAHEWGALIACQDVLFQLPAALDIRLPEVNYFARRPLLAQLRCSLFIFAACLPDFNARCHIHEVLIGSVASSGSASLGVRESGQRLAHLVHRRRPSRQS